MPYKFEYLKIKLPKELDRRIKLTDEDKLSICKEYYSGSRSQRKLAELYGVSRRSIQFIINPESLARNLEMRNARGGSGIYYDKDKNTQTMKEHRRYKAKVLKELKWADHYISF